VSQPWGGSQVVTGEAVALELRPAALPSRVVAGGIDAALQLALLLALGLVMSLAAAGTSSAGGAALFVVLLVVVLIVYPVAFETLLRGRTPGKAAMGLRVVRDDGGPIGFRQALVRGLAGAFLERFGITLFVAAVVTSLLNPANKRLGDLLAGTVVLQERVPATGGTVAHMPPQLAGWAAGLDLSGLPDDLALQARQFLGRSTELTPEAREQLGGRLVAAVHDAVRPPPPPDTPGWAVLSAVLAERRRREEARLGQRRADSGGAGAGAPSSGQGYGPPPGYGSAPGYGSPPGYGSAPGYGAPPGYGSAAGYGPPPGYGAPPQYGPPPGDGSARGYPPQPAPPQPAAAPEPPPAPGPGGFAVPS